jgi:hypothetical protein
LIIWTTMGGKTPEALSGSAMVAPPAMEAREAITASWMTRLPAVRAVICSPSRIDTPEETSVPSVRVKRDTADLRSIPPSTGMFSRSRSITSCPPPSCSTGGCRSVQQHGATRTEFGFSLRPSE